MSDPLPEVDEIQRLREDNRRWLNAHKIWMDEVARLKKQVEELSVHAEKWVKRATTPAHEREPPHCSNCSCGLPKPDIQAIWNKAVIIQDGNRATVAFETADEAEAAFDYIHDLGSIERSSAEPPAEHGGRIMSLAECVEAEGGIPFVGMEANTDPLTHQEIFSAVHHHAAEIVRLTACVPAACSASTTGEGALSKPHELMPERCKEFVAWLHRSRAVVGSKPVTDEVAVEAFDMVWVFTAKWREGSSSQGAGDAQA